MTPPAALHVGDRVRVCWDFLDRVRATPTVVLEVAIITRTRDGTAILGLSWPPAQPAPPSCEPEVIQ